MHGHGITLGDHGAQIEATPAHHTVALRVRPGDHQLLQLGLLCRGERRRPTTARAIAETADALVVVTVHPVAQRLPLHPAAFGSFPARSSFQQAGNREKPTRHPPVLAANRRRPEIRRRQIPPRDFDRPAHTAPRESCTQHSESEFAADGNPARPESQQFRRRV
jgi:hypothetical protein